MEPADTRAPPMTGFDFASLCVAVVGLIDAMGWVGAFFTTPVDLTVATVADPVPMM